MALTFNGSSSTLVTAKLPAGDLVPSYPFTVFGWAKVAAPRQNGWVAQLKADAVDTANAANHFMGILEDTAMRAYSSVGSGVSAFSSRSTTTGDWVPVMAVFNSQASRTIYYGTGAAVTDTVSVAVVATTLRYLIIGDGSFKGDLACIAVWSGALTLSDYQTLGGSAAGGTGGGAVPSTVSPSTLIDYWPMLTQAATQIGVKGGRVLTATSTTQASDHPITESADTTPPTLTGSITASSITTTSYTLTWPAGSDDVFVVGYDYSLDGGSTYVALGNVLTVNITGRTPGATDNVRVRARDAAGNTSTPVLSATVTLSGGGDTTPPTLTSPVGAGGALTCSGSVSTNEGNGTLYSVFTASATAPTAVQVEAGQDDTGSAALRAVSQAVSATGSQSVASGSITAGTRYAHFMHKDAAGNRSTVASSSSFTVTASGPTINTQPSSQSVTAPAAATFSVSATASGGSLTYQWQRQPAAGGGYTNISGATASSYTTGSTTVSGGSHNNGDTYRVVVTDSNGSTTSTAATLTVGAALAGLTSSPLKNNTGTVLTGIAFEAYVNNTSTGALVLKKTGLTSDGSGVCTFTDAALTATTAYRVVWRRTDTGAEGLETLTAT